jgi:oxygen-independent coproporphyrinogen-3 oxidase
VSPAALERDYVDAIQAEIRGHGWDWIPETVYLGGGTPSRLQEEGFSRILGAVPGYPWKEATIEVAPGTVTMETARMWRRAGISRVSLGVQSFLEPELRVTGRRHTAATVESEVAILRECGVEEINIDLIAGLPLQTHQSWSESLSWIERLSPPHVSVYMLEVDEDSRLGNEILLGGARYGASRVPGETVTTELYERAVDELARLGIERYEISNFARPGHESTHNLKYWRLEAYAGFGADAHSFDGRIRRWNAESAREYVDRHCRGLSFCVGEVEARGDEERFFVGLRLSSGIRPAEQEWTRWAVPIHRFLAAGLLEQRGDRIALSRRGVLVSNEVLQEFVIS